MEWDGGVEWNGRSGIGMGWRSGMGLRSPERVGKTSEMSENIGGGLNEIWYMTMASDDEVPKCVFSFIYQRLWFKDVTESFPSPKSC